MDLYSRKIIGWQPANQITGSSVTEAFQAAYRARNRPKGVLVHTDKGSQYASYEYQNRLKHFKPRSV